MYSGQSYGLGAGEGWVTGVTFRNLGEGPGAAPFSLLKFSMR